MTARTLALLVAGLTTACVGTSPDDVGDTDASGDTDPTSPDTDETDVAPVDTDDSDARADTDDSDAVADTDDSDAVDTGPVKDTDETDVPADTDDSGVVDTDDTDVIVVDTDDSGDSGVVDTDVVDTDTDVPDTDVVDTDVEPAFTADLCGVDWRRWQASDPGYAYGELRGYTSAASAWTVHPDDDLRGVLELRSSVSVDLAHARPLVATTPFAVELWVRPDGSEGVIAGTRGLAILGAPSGWQLDYYGGRIRFSTVSSVSGAPTGWRTSATAATVAAHVWHHVVLVSEGNATSAYVDGVSLGAQSGVLLYRTDAVPRLGLPDGTTLGAQIGSVRAWSSALTSAQVAQLHDDEAATYGRAALGGGAAFPAPTVVFEAPVCDGSDTGSPVDVETDADPGFDPFDCLDDPFSWAPRRPVSGGADLVGYPTPEASWAEHPAGDRAALAVAPGRHARLVDAYQVSELSMTSTITAWVRRGEQPGVYLSAALDDGSAVGWRVDDFYGLRLSVGTGGAWTHAVAGPSTVLSQDTWYHLAVTRSSTVITLWLDGVSVASLNTTALQPQVLGDARLGGVGMASAAFHVADVDVWGSALTQGQLRRAFNRDAALYGRTALAGASGQLYVAPWSLDDSLCAWNFTTTQAPPSVDPFDATCLLDPGVWLGADPRGGEVGLASSGDAAVWVPGGHPDAGALDLLATEVLRLPDVAFYTDTAIEAWVRIDPLWSPEGYVFVNQRDGVGANGFQVSVSGGSVVIGAQSGAGWVSSVVPYAESGIELGVWQAWTLSVSSACELRLYVDGELLNTLTPAGCFSYSAPTLRLGAAPSHTLPMQVGSVRTWARALTGQEVQASFVDSALWFGRGQHYLPSAVPTLASLLAPVTCAEQPLQWCDLDPADTWYADFPSQVFATPEDSAGPPAPWVPHPRLDTDVFALTPTSWADIEGPAGAFYRTEAVTFATWFKWTGTDGFILSTRPEADATRSGWNLAVGRASPGDTAARLTLHFQASTPSWASLSTPSYIQPDVWHHLALTVDAPVGQPRQLRLWIDGAWAAETTSGMPFEYAPGALARIGYLRGTSASGELTGLGVWTSVLTADQLAGEFNASAADLGRTALVGGAVPPSPAHYFGGDVCLH